MKQLKKKMIMGVMIMLIKDIFQLISEDSDNRSFLPLSVDVVTGDYYSQYIHNHYDIDNIINNDYGDYNITNIDNDSTWEIVSDVLNKNFKLFTFKHKITIDKLFEIDNISFNPIYNYDKTVVSSNIKSGESVSENIKAGTETNTTTHLKAGTENNTSVQSGGMTIDDIIAEETTTLNSDTAYNTNLVNSNKVMSNGTPSSTTTYNDLTTKNTLSFENRQDTNTNKLEFDGRRDTDTTTYNDITDRYTETTQGNIGVTTSTQMLSEYTQFYYSYSFWSLFWSLYIADFCDYYF